MHELSIITNAGVPVGTLGLLFQSSLFASGVDPILSEFGTHNGPTYSGETFGWDGRRVVAGDVAPVPEPETYAMLLAGLGLIGAVARRRQSDRLSGAKS